MTDGNPQNQPDEALVDLLIKQITEGLSPAEQRTLDSLDNAVVSTLRRDLELAAAAITLAATDPPTEMPPVLRVRTEQQAHTLFADKKVAELKAARETTQAGPLAAPAAPASRRGGVAGWVAAAACFLLALFGWLRPMQPPIAPPTAKVQIAAPPAAVPPKIPAAPTAAQERTALLARTESLKVKLEATKDPAAAGVTGDAVWDAATQRGFLHFVGLPANDPKVRQYQLWIIDGARDKRYPVDGGVFDVPANSSEVIVPIRAALPVRVAKAFAVTIERPGGVVVSAQRNVVVAGAAS
jgi:hypothetical protein